MLAPRDPLIGQAVGGSYVITRQLGEGGMGAVYLAASEMLAGKQVAVKVLLRECSEDAVALSRFRAEVFAAGKIHDPNIVRVFDAGYFPDGRMYMLMEFCAGGSLYELLQKGVLSAEQTLNLIGPVASALDEAHHEARITHRDIKPGNILLVQEPGGPLRAKLGDFGIAKLHADRIDGRGGTRQILGSPGYVAPEQVDLELGSGHVDHRADVFALASVMYEMLTGRKPYMRESMYGLIEAVLSHEPIPRPRSLRPDLPKECDDAIMGGLVHDRNARTQTAKELVLQFARGVPGGLAKLAFVAPRLVTAEIASHANTISQSIGPAATEWAATAERAARERARRKRQPRLLAAALLGGVVLGAGALYVMTGGRRDGAGAGTGAGTAAPPVVGASAAPVESAVPAATAAPATAATAAVPVALETPSAAAPSAPAAAAVPALPTSSAVAPVVPAVSPVPPVTATAPPPIELAPAKPASVPPVAPVQVSATVASRAPQVATANSAAPPANPPGNPAKTAPVLSTANASGAKVAATGSLLVNVAPYADVIIDGVAAGSSPVRRMLAVGTHTIKLVGETRTETLRVTVSASKPTVINRSW